MIPVRGHSSRDLEGCRDCKDSRPPVLPPYTMSAAAAESHVLCPLKSKRASIRWKRRKRNQFEPQKQEERGDCVVRETLFEVRTLETKKGRLRCDEGFRVGMEIF